MNRRKRLTEYAINRLPDRHLYYADVPVAGKRKRVRGKSRDEVYQELTRLDKLVEQGYRISTTDPTLRDLADHWLEHHIKPLRRETTYITYRKHLDQHILPALGTELVRTLSYDTVQGFLNGLIARKRHPLSASYVSSIRRTLRAMLNHAVRRGLVERNVVASTVLPTAEKRAAIALTTEEIATLLQHLEGHRLESVVGVALGTGMRLGEVLGLRWENVDLERGEIRVEGQVQEIPGQGTVYQSMPKTRSSRRTIPMTDTARHYLRLQQDRQTFQRQGPTWEEHGYVFTTRSGRPFSPTNVSDDVRRFMQSIPGFRVCRFHDLRHTFASILQRSGASLRVVQEYLGHEQFSFTADTYVHLYEDEKRSAAERVSAWMKSS